MCLLAKHVMLVPHSICLVMKRGEKYSEKQREWERAKEAGFGKPGKRTEGCHSSTAQAVRLSSGVLSKMQPAPYGWLGSAISREELPACVFGKNERMCDSETLMFMQNIKPGFVTAVQFCLK